MANQKVYTIQINGLTESIGAVESLNKQLDNLDKRISALSSKSVNVSTGGGSTSTKGSVVSEQNEINKLKQQEAQLNAKIAASQNDIFKAVDATKAEYKKVLEDQKAIAAEERYTADQYTHTMVGLKQKLADIKQMIQTTVYDEPDGNDRIKQLTTEANELNSKLKEMEQAYGQFGRNVGNYQDAANGFKGLRFQIAGTVQEFDNAKQALKTLQGELRTLQVKKDNGMLLSEEELKRFEELPSVVAHLKSSIQDAGKPMDALMDTMQSLVAMAQVSKGFSAFFGFDDSEIQKSIQQLLALQNALQGLQTIQKQLQSGEFLGGIFKSGDAAIKSFTDKLFGLDKTAKAASTSVATVGTAGKAASTGLTTASVAANTAAKSFSLASAAATALRVILNALGIGVAIAAISALISVVDELITKQKEAVKIQKELAEGIKDSQKEYAKATAELKTLKTRLDNFNGSKKEEKKLVDELNNKYGNTIGQYKTIEQWQTALINKGAQYSRALQLQAENQALLNMYTEAYIKLQEAKRLQAEGGEKWKEWMPWNWGGKSAQQKADENVAALESQLSQIINLIETNDKAIAQISKDSGILDYAPQIEKNGKKTKDAVEKTQDEINKKEIEAMRDGLNKTLMQFDEEERQTINKIKKNGVKTAEEIAKVNQIYNAKRTKAILEYLTSIQTSIAETSDKIAKTKFEINIKGFEQQIKDLQNDIDKLSLSVPISQTLTTSAEYRPLIDGVPENAYIMASTFDSLKEASLSSEDDLKEYLKFLDDWNKELGNKFGETYTNVDTGLEEIKVDYDSFETWIEGMYAKELYAIREYGKKLNKDLGVIDTSLNNSFQYRIDALRAYNEDYIDLVGEKLKEQEELEKKAEIERYNSEQNELDHQYQSTDKALKKRKDTIEDALTAIGNLTKKSNAEISESDKKTYKDLIEALEKATDTEIKTYADFEKILKEQQEAANYQLQQNEKQYYDKYEQNMKAHKQRVIEIERQTDEKIKQNKQRYYDEQISNYRDFINKLNDESSKNPVTDKQGWGVVMALSAKENYREILAASETTIKSVLKDKEQLNKDFKNGLIDPAAYNATLKELNDIQKSAENAQQTVKEKQRTLVADFVQSIQMYIQEAVNSFNTIMNAVWDMQDNAFDDEQEMLDKDNEKIKTLLDEQENLISKHTSAIDSIEDELANSRGDRRQHLIDQLNAEMEAERRAQAEKKRLQQEEEANKKKQEQLDLKRKKAQYKRDLLQAIVNGAMAVTMAAINNWPIPAIPMMALAGATTAAQIAIMSANKPYATGGQLDGGQIVGNRHRDGGVKVLGGRAEVEGGEYITNRLTTAKNLDLLEYVNSKKKRIDISDMLEFYNGGRVKTSIQKVRTKFEDGGYIAPLPDTIDIKEQLQNIVVNQDNRPIYVSVVDINNKQADVRRVQTLAGLSE